MAVTGFSFSERFSRWQVLASNLRESPAVGAVLTEELATIDRLLAEARSLQDRQAQLRGQSQELTKQLVTIARDGDRARSRVGAVLQGKLGFTNEELVRYGFRPRKPPVRRRRAVAQVAQVAQQPAAGPRPAAPAPAPGAAPQVAPPAETTPPAATQASSSAPRG